MSETATAETATETTETSEATATQAATTTETAADWRAALPAELRESDALKNVKDVGDMATQLVNAQKLVGADKVALPGQDATPEQLGEFYAKLGRPATAGDYGLEPVAMPEGVPPIPTETVGAFGDKAHELGLTTRQATGILKWFEGITSEGATQRLEQMQGQEKSAMEALQKDWGNATESNTKVAQQAMNRLSERVDGLREFMNETRFGNNPTVIRLMNEVGKMIGEDTVTGRGTDETHATPQQARAALNTKQMDADWNKARLTPTHPRHKEVMAEYQKLIADSMGESNTPVDLLNRPKGVAGV